MTGGTAVADPMYRVIAEELRQEIESGELSPGAQLPTEFELRDRFSASRNTVRDAIKALIALGLVVTRPGQGTFVTERIDPFVTTLSSYAESGFGGGEGATYLSEVSEAHRNPFIGEPRVEIQVASGEIASRLRVSEGTQLISRHQRRYIDDKPWSLQTSFYPMDFVLKGATRLLEATNIEEGTVRYLQETLGLKQVGYRDWITVRAPDANELTFFRIPGDGRVPVFEIFRTAFDESGNPMRVTVSTFPVDRSQFIVNVGEVPAPQLGVGG